MCIQLGGRLHLGHYNKYCSRESGSVKLSKPYRHIKDDSRWEMIWMIYHTIYFIYEDNNIYIYIYIILHFTFKSNISCILCLVSDSNSFLESINIALKYDRTRSGRRTFLDYLQFMKCKQVWKNMLQMFGYNTARIFHNDIHIEIAE